MEIIEDEVQVEALTPQETADLADSLYAVMMRVVSSAVSLSTLSIEEKLQKAAQDLAKEVAEVKPTQREYEALMAVLARYSQAEVFSLGALIDNLYVDLAGALGKDKCAMLMHRVLLYYCDYRAQKYQQLYDENGFDFLLEDANRYRNKYRVLSTELAPGDLAAGLNTYYIVATVRTMSGQSGVADFLSTDEILMLLKAQNCTALALDADVWYELLTLAKDFITDEYYTKIINAAINNGDITLLAEGVNELISLVRHIQLTLDASDIQAIRQGASIVDVILSTMEDDQLYRLDAFLSKEWHYSKYDDLAKKQYGDDYQRFVQRTKTLTIDQLLARRQDATDASALLVGYLAGKSYALAWEVQP